MRNISVSQDIVDIHIKAVKNLIDTKFDKKQILNDINKIGVKSIDNFLSADVNLMRKWTLDYPEHIKFNHFKKIYENYFSNGSDKYVDDDYNAYKFLEYLGITVCPYCDDEYLFIISSGQKKKRTCEIDHFFSKSKYPALSMCFYNLVPSGQNCNGLKLNEGLGVSPYEDNIESQTYLYPDIPVGVLLEGLKPDDCKVKFHPKEGMKDNVRVLGLENRYEIHAPEAHRLLKNKQFYNEEKIQELIKLGLGTREEIISSIFGPQNPTEKKKRYAKKC